ncbi:MAG: ATPase, T2SS/T4P/T4SS family [Ethanoligenens sp.]
MISDHFTFQDGDSVPYRQMFEIVQRYVSAETPEAVNKPEQLPGVIERYLINRRAETNRPLPAVCADLAEDMGGVSAVLAKYLNHLPDYPTLEEINVNGWNSIVLKYTDRPDEWLEETFLSPRHARSIMEHMISRSRTGVLNENTPGAVSYIVEGVRNTVLTTPIVPKDVGVYASIRIVRPQSVSGERLLSGDELSPDMLELLVLFMLYGANMVFSGKPRAGKTALLNYLLSIAAKKHDVRIGTIEEGSRELTLRRFDGSGRPVNQVLSLLTRPSEKPESNFNPNRLLEYCLRYDLDYLIPQEMRSEEAYSAQETARTGMAVHTTIHCAHAKAAYPRIVTLCQQRSNELASTLLGYAVEAFPVSVHLKYMADEKRRCMEILEAEGTRGGIVKTRPLFRFAVKDNVRPETGVRVVGQFEQTGRLSGQLQETLLRNGAALSSLQKFI